MTNRCRAVLLAMLAGGCLPPDPAPPLRPPPPTPAELAARLGAAYHAWQAEGPPAECKVYFAPCADAFTRRAGFDPQDLAAPSPKSFASNPDPEWIPAWDKIPMDTGHRHLAFGAIAYAAITKPFFASCRRDFDAIDLIRAEESKRLASELGAIDRLADPYAKLGRLVLYRKQLKMRLSDPVGPRYDLELAIFERFSRSGRGFLYELQSQRSEEASVLRPAFSFEEERDLYCIGQGIPAWQDAQSVPWPFVLAPIPEARKAALLQKAKAAQDLEAKLPAGGKKLPEIEAGELPAKGAMVLLPKTILGMAPLVKEVRDGKDGVLTIHLTGRREQKGALYDCKTTDKIEKIEAGKPIYETACKKRDEVHDLTIVVRLPERPDIVVQKGDQVALVGKVTTAEIRSDSAGAHTIRRRLEVDAVHVLEIWRAGLLVADYFVQ